jgi:hypothetical protein
MKNKLFPSSRYRPSAGGLLLALAFLLCASASAQNLLKNGNFESPFPVSDQTAGWALVYVDGGPGDFALAGQTTEASAGGGGRGAQFRAKTWNSAHAYFNQVVTNLTEGAVYTLNILKMRSAFKYTDDSPSTQKVYTSMISGSSSNAVHGYSTNTGPYSLSITCGASRQIEVQLHMSKDAMSADVSEHFKSSRCMAWFDEFSLTLAP